MIPGFTPDWSETRRSFSLVRAISPELFFADLPGILIRSTSYALFKKPEMRTRIPLWGSKSISGTDSPEILLQMLK